MQAESGGKAELIFVAVGILAKLSILNNRMEDAVDMVESFGQIAKTEAPKLLPNIKAMTIRIQLYTGRIGRIYQWLSQEAPNEEAQFHTIESYRYLTKIRI